MANAEDWGSVRRDRVQISGESGKISRQLFNKEGKTVGSYGIGFRKNHNKKQIVMNIIGQNYSNGQYMRFNGTFYCGDTPIKFVDWGAGSEIGPGGTYNGKGEVNMCREGNKMYFEPDCYFFNKEQSQDAKSEEWNPAWNQPPVNYERRVNETPRRDNIQESYPQQGYGRESGAIR